MDVANLNKWSELLLDTGKRNNLINFKETKLLTAEVVAPKIDVLFSKATAGGSFEVFDPKTDDDDDLVVITEKDLKEKRVTRQEYVRTYGGKIKKNGQMLIFNQFVNPIRALKNIGKKAKTAVEETGVNIAYMAFGFVNWIESDNPQYVMHAPLLLVPITIENESSLDPYYVQVTDDEIIVNPTFAFKLQNDFGIKLPEYDDEPIEEYFVKVEKLISKRKWTVARECKIGIFSFLKINMYQDLKENASVVLENKNVLALLGQALPNNKDDASKDEAIDPLDLHNVIDADSSQSEAIEMARAGKSFVLQGPPGTGKSQTITNIIAESLYDGKKVLFVSEKLAALNVVYDKLKKVGLEEFCLELHSHKANKKDVINDLVKTLRLSPSSVSDRADRELESRKRLQKELDEYAVELHRPRSGINKTLYQMFEAAAAYRDYPDVEFIIENVTEKNEDYLDEAEAELNRFEKYIPSIGYAYRHNFWYGYKNTDCSYQTVLKLKNNLQNTVQLYTGVLGVNAKTAALFGIEAKNVEQAYAMRALFDALKKSEFITPRLLASNNVSKIKENVKAMSVLATEIIDQRKILQEICDEKIYELNGQDCNKKLTTLFVGGLKRAFSGEYKRIVKEIKKCKKDGKKPKYDDAVMITEALSIYQSKNLHFTVHEKQTSDYFGNAYNGVDTDFKELINELDVAIQAKEAKLSLGKLTKMNDDEFVANKEAFIEISEALNLSIDRFGFAEEQVFANFDEGEYNVRLAGIPEVLKKLQGCLDNVDKLDNWCEFNKLLRAMSKLGLLPFVDYCITQKIPKNCFTQTYKKAFYSQWIDVTLHESPILLSLSRIPHDLAVKQFKDKDKLNFEVNKAKIKARLSAQRPSLDMVAQGSQVSVLLREGEKKRKQKNIRVLMDEIGELVQTLKPCFLMSPLSVSTFLSKNMKFDLVVFDEASQIFPQDAIGAIYRGKQLIVVGDSKQMPPSNFFTSMAVSDDDEEEDVCDFESILDLCSTTLPQKRLKWHYRSRYEPLISFSNKNFYENDLVTFPSAKKNESGAGVDYFYVDGVFDRKSKTNRIEAEYIVDLVFKNIEEHPHRSLGVVAFSISQQALIDKLIFKRRLQDPTKEFFFKSDKAEPFFVKNLETVQGDERDTIIFSVAYGKDEQDKLLLNFGPINRVGGERRLNVAVTRAKYNVQLVSSMHYGDIDLSRTNSLGAKLLREYLDYAENGETAFGRTANSNPFEQYDSEFEQEVCEFLRTNGYQVDMQVGRSAFKVDLGVKRSATSDYVLAVECDGEVYHSSKNARDRDRLRQEILEIMGWRFYRIWSTDWFRNKESEKEKLLIAARNAMEKSEFAIQNAESTFDVSFEEAARVKRFEFPKYVMADEFRLLKSCNYDVARVCKAMLDVEAPLSEEWLLKRLAFMFGRAKVTNFVRDEFNDRMRDCSRLGIQRKNGFLYLQGKEIPLLRVPSDDADEIRSIAYIAIEELALGIKEVLRQNGSVEKSGLFRLLVQQLGFSRMGDAINERLEAALESLSNEVVVNGNMLSLK